MKHLTTALLCLLVFSVSEAQTKFRVRLEPQIPREFPGLHSYAWAREGNKLLLMGGRLDGLHARQPFASFSKSNNNREIFLLDLSSMKLIRRSIMELPTNLAEQLQSSNMQFFQEGDKLILAGGYGYSELKKDHISFPNLTLVSVKGLILALENGNAISACFRQIEDQRMAVTGANLSKLKDHYYLVGGHRFDGRYNPHGPDHGPGYSQQYTEQIRIFRIDSSKGELSISHYEAITDTSLLHRRDYNLVSQYDGNGEEMLTVFSGVFRKDADLPFTNLIDIKEGGYKELEGFSQEYSNYHCAHLPIYDSRDKKQYVIFFGGIAWNYRNREGKLQKDENIPFSSAISVVERDGNAVKEYLLDDLMPGYFGSAASFIPGDEKQFSSNGNLKWEFIGKQPLLAGYIIGGIDSQAPNVFWSNGNVSRASPVVWEVYISRE